MYTVRPIIPHFLIWLVLAPLFLVEARVFDAVRDRQTLQDDGIAQRSVAEVTEYRPGAEGGAVRYRFQVPGDPRWYSSADVIGLRGIWVPVTTDARTQAVAAGGRLMVAYLPSDPWVNRLDGQAGDPLLGNIAGWAFFLVFDLLWLFETFVLIRNYAHAQVLAERRQPVRMRFWQVRPA